AAPPKTDVPSVKELELASTGSRKCRVRCILWYAQQPCEPWLCGRQPWMPSAAYIAPMGWQVFAGLIFPVVRAIRVSGIHSSMVFTPGISGLLPGWDDQVPGRCHQRVCYIAREVDGAGIAGIRSAVVVRVELF